MSEKEVTAKEIRDELIKDGILDNSKKGIMSLEYLDVKAEGINPDVVGSMLQTWLENWMKKKNYYFKVQQDTQKRPDIFLKKNSKTEGLLEVKAFYKSPAFDIQSWNAFLNLIEKNPSHIYADYIIFDYDIIGNDHFIMENIFLKKIWEISRPMGERSKISWPVSVQYKNNEIVNLRPTGTKDMIENKTYFNSALEFLEAIQKTIEIYGKAKISHKDGKWLEKVKNKYKKDFNKDLD